MTTRKKLPVWLNDAEVDALLAQISTRSTTGLRNRVMLQVMVGAGLRVSEVTALRGRDMDLTDGVITVVNGKGGKGRVVPVDGETREWLQQWQNKRLELGLNGRHPVFVGLRTGRTGLGEREERQGLGDRYVQQLVRTLARAASIEKDVTPHVLRHTYAVRMLRKPQISIYDLQQLLGHADISTTAVYLHVAPEELKAKVQGDEPQVGLRQLIGALDPAQLEAMATWTPEQLDAFARGLRRE